MRTARVLKTVRSMTRKELVKDVIEKCEKNETYLMAMSEDVFSFYKDCGMTRDEASGILTSITKIHNTLARYKFDIWESEESSPDPS